MSTTATRRGGDYVLPPHGTHIGRCYAIIDLGTQQVVWKGATKLQAKVHIRFELPNELMEDGQPFSVGTTYTNSTDPKARLRHDLESWAGRSMTAEEEAGFDLKKLLGKACQVTVTHDKGRTDPTKTYANIKAITPLAKGMTAPEPVNEHIHYQVEDGHTSTYEQLSDYLKKKIAECQEWKPQAQGQAYADAGEESQEIVGGEPEEDNIPF